MLLVLGKVLIKVFERQARMSASEYYEAPISCLATKPPPFLKEIAISITKNYKALNYCLQ